jgi:O-methyltransferase
MQFPPYGRTVHHAVMQSEDPVRLSSVALALHSINTLAVPGALAELGVYRGEMSRHINRLAQGRPLYLFDTFAGFPNEGEVSRDTRFDDTSVDIVLETVGHAPNVIIKQGWFPESAQDVQDERFAFVMLDADRHEPTFAGLEFFYPRLNAGGYIFLHDFNNPESDRGVSRAAHAFLADKPERLIELPDRFGSAVLRRVYQ